MKTVHLPANNMIHKKLIITYIIISLLLSACDSPEAHRQELAYTATSFSAPISCITPSNIPGRQYIGLENGDIVIRDADNRQTRIDAGDNRVYDIFEYNAPKDTLLLVGIRDEGLKVYRKRNDTFGIIKNAYPFPDTGEPIERGTGYGVYSICLDSAERKFILGTSNGCCYLEAKNPTGELRPYAQQVYSNHHGFNKVWHTGGKNYLATDSVLLLAQRDRITDSLFHRQSVRNLFVKNDTLYACIKTQGVYGIDLRNPEKQIFLSVRGDFYAYARDLLNGEWYVSKNEIHYHSGRIRATQTFPQGMSIKGRQLLSIDESFVSVACHDLLVNFSIHQNIQENTHNVVTLCRDDSEPGENFYFITKDYRLHRYSNGETSTSGKIKGLRIGDNIIKSCMTAPDKLWLMTDKSLFLIHTDSPKAVCIDSTDNRNDFRSMFYDKEEKRLYVGSRTHLSYVDPERAYQPIVKKGINRADNDLYVTDICRIGSYIYIATLNKGLFRFPADRPETPANTLINGSDKYGNIKHLIVDGPNLYVHTSRNLYAYIDIDSMRVNDKIRLDHKSIKSVVSDRERSYIIGYQGFTDSHLSDQLHKSTCDRLMFRDIVFNDAALLVTGNTLIAGSRFGLFRYNGTHMRIPELIRIEPEKDYTQLFRLLSGIGLLFVATGILMGGNVYRSQKKRKKKAKALLERISHCLTSIEAKDWGKKEKEKMYQDTERLKNKLIQATCQKHISQKDVDILEEEVFNVSLQLGISQDAKDYNLEKLKSKYELDALDMIILEILSGKKHPEKDRINKRTFQSRQQNIALKLGLSENNRSHIVAEAFRRGLLQ